MAIFQGLNISSSALTAQRLRMDVISSNMANQNTTRSKKVNGEWVPYQRKIVEMAPINGSFQSQLDGHLNGYAGGGVQVTGIVNDPTPFKMVYQPDSPDADKNGYVKMPNVDPLKEMVDLMSATRSYEANVTVMNANKNMLLQALNIGK